MRPTGTPAAAALILAACAASGAAPPGVRAGLPDHLWCRPDGSAPLAVLAGRPLAAFDAIERTEGVVYDIAGIGPDGSAALLAIETDDIITVLHRDGVIESVSCIRRDVCSPARAAASGLCARR